MKTRNYGEEQQAVGLAETAGALHNGRHAVAIKRILMPVDFGESSSRALQYALALAEGLEARLILLHVVEPAHAEGVGSLGTGLDEANQNVLQEARERLATLAVPKPGGRARVEPLVRMGHAHSEIPDTAKALGADLLVLGTHGHTSLNFAGMGSTAEKVLQHAPCPVLVVR